MTDEGKRFWCIIGLVKLVIATFGMLITAVFHCLDVFTEAQQLKASGIFAAVAIGGHTICRAACLPPTKRGDGPRAGPGESR